MNNLLIEKASIVRPDRIEGPTDVFVESGSIRCIGAGARAAAERSGENYLRIDAEGKYLSPGFIDLHIHGCQHHLVDAGREALGEICRLLPSYGVTGFLPTVLPRKPETHSELLGELASGSYRGTTILGFFLEGPFLKLPGAIPAEALVERTAQRVEDLKAAAAPYPAIFAAAPDVDKALDLIPLMARSEGTPSGRVPVFITHTHASVEETQAGIEAGIRHATHFYDVFPIPQDVDPGVRPCGAVEAILADPRVSVDFILDGEHVHPVAVRMALQAKGPGGVSLVTDANIGAGLAPGRYEGLGGTEIEFAYEGAPARMTEKTGRTGCLAGSGLTMDRAVRNAVSMAGVDLAQAVRMASLNPAAVLCIDEETGSIEEDKRADLVLLDREIKVEKTWVRGELVFDRG